VQSPEAPTRVGVRPGQGPRAPDRSAELPGLPVRARASARSTGMDALRPPRLRPVTAPATAPPMRPTVYRHHTVLTHEDVVRLTRMVQAGLEAAATLRSYPLTTGRERRQLRRVVRAGYESQDQLLFHNLRLVMKYANATRVDGMTFDDHFQNGVLGLMHAIEMFNPDSGHRLSTYATWWIRQSIARGVAREARLIRLPVHVLEQLRSLDRARQALLITTGRATRADLAAHTGLSDEKVAQLLPLILGIGSLDSVVGDGLTTLGALLPAPDEPDREDGPIIRGVLEKVLEDRELEVLRLRFGLVDGAPLTLAAVGRRLGVTSERVRQIQETALTKLRRPLSEALGYVARRSEQPVPGASQESREALGRHSAPAAVRSPWEVLTRRAEAAAAGMAPRDATTLSRLLECTGAVTYQQLAELLGVPESNVGRLLDHLDKALADAGLPPVTRASASGPPSARWPV